MNKVYDYLSQNYLHEILNSLPFYCGSYTICSSHRSTSLEISINCFDIQEISIPFSPDAKIIKENYMSRLNEVIDGKINTAKQEIKVYKDIKKQLTK